MRSERGHEPIKRQLGKESQKVRKLLYDWDRLKIKDDVLYRVSTMNSETMYQLVLPVDYREKALKALHDDAGHKGSNNLSGKV